MRTLAVLRIAIGFAALLSFVLPAEAATESVLYSFKDDKSAGPAGRLRFIHGSLYGSALGDGLASTYGQIFELTDQRGSWKKTGLLTFDNRDGNSPYAGVISDSSGILYGTTSGGDKYDGGNVFELYKSGGKWVHHTIWAFGGTGDGSLPTCDLVIDKSGNLYGTTYQGGAQGVGTVFELSKVNGAWTETILHSFVNNQSDGWEPYAGLLMVGPGRFYGTTFWGGNRGGDGTVFELSKSGGTWKEKLIYSFAGGDGYEPMGTLIRDQQGALYGTTYAGGVSNFYSDVGTVFKVYQSRGQWKEQLLHSFGGALDGWNPFAGLAWGPSGVLYGTTSEGGCPGHPGVGTVFQLTPLGGRWTETILHCFVGNTDGTYPAGAVTLDNRGNLYGTTEGGGTRNLGTVWKIDPVAAPPAGCEAAPVDCRR